MTTVSNTPHAIGWRAIRDCEALAAKALEVYPDEQEPPADRARLRAQWSKAVQYLRAGPGFVMDRPVPRKADPAEPPQ